MVYDSRETKNNKQFGVVYAMEKEETRKYEQKHITSSRASRESFCACYISIFWKYTERNITILQHIYVVYRVFACSMSGFRAFFSVYHSLRGWLVGMLYVACMHICVYLLLYFYDGKYSAHSTHHIHRVI